MIYAIRAVGTEYIKFGKAASVGRRLKELETANPHELHIEAVADWPDEAERSVHIYLQWQAVRGEWFKQSIETDQVIEWMRDANGLLRVEHEARKILRAVVRPLKLSRKQKDLLFQEDFGRERKHG